MRFVTVVLLVSLWSAAEATPPEARSEMLVQVCFSPAGSCAAHILDALDKADQEVLVAMYAFTSVVLARALIRARERGVDVRVIIDADFDQRSSNSMADLLARNGIPVAKVSGTRRVELDAGLMHQKFAVVDQTTVASGSYNWTHSAEAFNYENLLIFRNAEKLAREFRAEFIRLWGR